MQADSVDARRSTDAPDRTEAGVSGAGRPRIDRLRAVIDRHPMVARALVLTLVWEIVTEFVGVAASLLIPPHTADTSAFIHRSGVFAGQHINRVDAIWVRWDGIYYSMLGMHGYGSTTGPLNAFFPAYPVLIHVVGFLIGGQYVIAAVLINRILLFPAVLMFMKLVQREGTGDPREKQFAPILFLLMPGAVFFLGALTEMLFVSACLACLLALRRERYVLAGLACALATATRLPGVVLLGAMAVEMLCRRVPWKTYGAVLIGLAGVGSYSLFTLITQHDAFAFKAAYAPGNWNDQTSTLNIFRGPLRYLHESIQDPPYKDYGGIVTAGYLGALVLVVLLLALTWRRMPWSYRVFAIGTAVIPLLSGSMFSYYRYSMVPLLPILIVSCPWLAVRPIRRDTVVLCLAGLAFFDIMAFAGSYWVS